MRKYILAIDQGTTGSRAIIYDKNGNNVASAYEEFPQYFPQAGWVEHEPEEIWQSVNNSIQKVLKQVAASSIVAIGITNQRETTVLWDKKNGRPLSRAIVWQCRRTTERCEKLKKNKVLTAKINKKTGLPVDAYFSASKLEWLLKNVPGAKARSQKGELCFGTTDSWILWKLTGGQVHATDYTNASRTMLFNINELCWDKELLKLFNVPASVLPVVKPSSGVFGVTVQNGKLPAGIPIAGIAGDQQAALFGQCCVEPGTLKNTYGTGAFMLLNTGKKRITSKYGLITTIGCDAKGEPAYVLEGSVFIAGAAIQWLRDQLQVINKASDSQTICGSLTDNDGVYFVPAFVGLGAPYWVQEARGIISGITRGTTRAHLVRAAVEAMCYQTKDVLVAMQKDSGLKIKDLKVDGGAVRDSFLCQFQADLLGINVVRPQIIETTSLGAAYLAGLALGYWQSTSEIKKCWLLDKKFLPQMSKNKAALFYKGWQQAVQKAMGLSYYDQ